MHLYTAEWLLFDPCVSVQQYLLVNRDYLVLEVIRGLLN